MKVVVTGGAGFVGANLVRTLTRRPGIAEVVVVDDLSTGSVQNLSSVQRPSRVEVRLIVGSVLDPTVLDAAMSGASSVVHLAALPSVPRSVVDPVSSHEANASGTLQVLQAARRAGNLHVVAASSASVYGANPTLPKHESMPPAPVSPYAVSKLATETYTLAFGHTYGMETLAFRFFNIYGPLQPPGHAYAAVVPAFLDAAMAGQPVQVHGDGEQTRDFTYVSTVCEVLADAVLRRVSDRGPVNLAFGTRTSLNHLVALMESVLGHDLRREHTDARPGDVRDSQADCRRLLALFPDIEPAGLDEGITETARWFKALSRAA